METVYKVRGTLRACHVPAPVGEIVPRGGFAQSFAISAMLYTLLMEKYRLNPKQLEGVLRKLVDADLITHMQIYERTSFSDSQAAIKELD